VKVFGISRDSPWSHVAWAQALDLSTPLLSDWNGDAVGGSWTYETAEVPDFDELLAAARSLS
jgi:peroxiredoxin